MRVTSSHLHRLAPRIRIHIHILRLELHRSHDIIAVFSFWGANGGFDKKRERHFLFCVCSLLNKPTVPENGTHHTAAVEKSAAFSRLVGSCAKTR